MSEPLHITPEQRSEIAALLSHYLPGIEVWAFGSRVKRTARTYSDLDLVAFCAPEDNGRLAELREAFEESSLPFRVDLLVWRELPENFQKNIQDGYTVLQTGCH